MTLLLCGRTSLHDRIEEITRVLREDQGFRTDGGCGRAIDLDNPIQHMGIYRCLQCSRWLCKSCIVAHFEETTHAYGTTPQRRPGAESGAQINSKGGHSDAAPVEIPLTQDQVGAEMVGSTPPSPRAAQNDALIEALADAEHASWARWTDYQFGRCKANPDGSLTIPAALVERWRRQAATPYADLSEAEKESDRKEVREILPLIQAAARAQNEKAADQR